MSLPGLQQSLDALVGLKKQIAIKHRLLLHEQRLVQAELATLEELLRKKRYQKSILMQSHLQLLSTNAADRLKELDERTDQLRRPAATLNQEFTAADKRFNTRMRFVEGALFRQDQRAVEAERATHILDARKEFIHALHQLDRQEAIRKWAGEPPEAIQRWKDAEGPHIEAHLRDDPQRDAILTASEIGKDPDIEVAKARYLALLAEFTALVDQVCQLDSALADTDAERMHLERQAKAESHMLRTIFAQHLFDSKPELEAYHLAIESLTAACQMHVKRLEASQEKTLFRNRKQIEEMLASDKKAIDPNSAKAFRTRVDKALADRSVDALAQIRRELAELFELALQAKSNPSTARVFEAREHSARTVISAAEAFADGAPGSAEASSEASKAVGAAREWEELVQPNDHRQRDDDEQDQLRTKI